MATRLATIADVVGSALEFWVDATKISQGDNTLLALFPDQSVLSGARSGSARDATQGTSTAQPTFRTAGFPGSNMPAVVCASGKFMSVAGIPTYAAANGLTIYCAFQNTTDTGQKFLYSSTTTGAPGLRVVSGNYLQFLSSGIQVRNTSPVFTNVVTNHVAGADAISGGTTIYVDGGTGTAATNDPAFTSPLTQLFGYQGGSNFIGAFGEMFAASRKLTLAEHQTIQGILAWKWDGGVAGALVGQLPANHPYKSAAPTVTTGGTVTTRRRPLILMAS